MGKFYPVVDEDGLETVLLILEALAKSEEAAIREKSIASITQLRYFFFLSYSIDHSFLTS